MKTVTKVVFLLCLVALIIVPVIVWVVDPTRSLQDIAGFIGASAGPLGVLTGAMAARGISRDKQQK